MKQAVIIGFLGQTQDRFSAYHEPATTAEKLQLAASVPEFSGVEIVYPYETDSPGETRDLLEWYGLEVAAVNVNIKKEAAFVPGAVSRPVVSVRREALRFLKEAKDFAEAIGAPRVTCCPLSDGYDHLFQVDYRSAWRHLVEIFGEAADYKRHVPLFLEPKYSETRVHCHLDTTATALLLLRDIGIPETGITLDFGHSLYAGENPARALISIVESGFLPYIHTNDNDQRFDWDLAAGSRHLLHFAELLFYALECGYDDFFTTDASPRIFDRTGYFRRHAVLSRALYERVGSLDRRAWLSLMEREAALELMERVQQEVYRL